MKLDKIMDLGEGEIEERVCIHKGNSCEKENICDGHGKYFENGKVVYCGKEVYREIGLWRTFY